MAGNCKAAVQLVLCALLLQLVTRPAAAYFTYTLNVYAHLTLGGKSPTEIAVAPYGQEYGFGSIIVADDFLTSGQAANTKAVGRVKGLGANTDGAKGNLNSSLYLTFLIDYLGFKGTVVVAGTSVRTDTTRPFAIVGGTGDFVLAQGQVTQKTVAVSQGSDGGVTTTNLWSFTFYYELFHPALAQLSSDLALDGVNPVWNIV